MFEEIRGWGPVTGSLPFMALLVGIFGAAGLNMYNNKYYFKLFRENGNRAELEARLPSMMIGGASLGCIWDVHINTPWHRHAYCMLT